MPAYIRPIRLSITATANYSDNLTGQIIQSVIAAGGVVPGLNSNQSSNSLDLMAVATYTPASNLQTSGFFERRTQSFLGEDYGVKSYGGGATYTHSLLDGTINSSVSVSANSVRPERRRTRLAFQQPRTTPTGFLDGA